MKDYQKSVDAIISILKLMIIAPQQLMFKSAPGAIYLVSMGLFYSERTFVGKAVLSNQNLHPAAILRAGFCLGETIERNNWRKIIFSHRKKERIRGKTRMMPVKDY
ncbi:hypothetical protein EZ428_11530 [Pedobacter frigiditerrae]|uniref:Uncharacterized protein n=1 Tax=Pedobacter frigiditerrae TaxID=2530452 RepID=A0A4R0MYH6_9SPHI|nr:hypothetical protein [Pedobacter frigiditerrae]TCC92350.1 hypothetical protein EZ428_11530 [Pedobacter frigiditerrae]